MLSRGGKSSWREVDGVSFGGLKFSFGLMQRDLVISYGKSLFGCAASLMHLIPTTTSSPFNSDFKNKICFGVMCVQ